jgi:hypothetical protein
MNERLAVISTKNPKKEVLLKCIQNLKLFYEEFDIVIIDSDSENLSCYEYVPSDCIIDLCKNKNYELGAWTFAFNKYNNYKVYMFIQDTIIPNIRIPILDKNLYQNGTIYTWDYGFITKISDGGYLENLRNVYKNTQLHFISQINQDHIIRGAAHNFFILNKEDIPIILQLENAYINKNIVKTKIDSLLGERTIGIMADFLPIRINIKDYFTKIHCDRI